MDMTSNELFPLAGKAVLLTGGATCMGPMAAHGLVAAGTRVMIASRKVNVCGTVVAELNKLNIGNLKTAAKGGPRQAARACRDPRSERNHPSPQSKKGLPQVPAL